MNGRVEFFLEKMSDDEIYDDMDDDVNYDDDDDIVDDDDDDEGNDKLAQSQQSDQFDQFDTDLRQSQDGVHRGATAR